MRNKPLSGKITVWLLLLAAGLFVALAFIWGHDSPAKLRNASMEVYFLPTQDDADCIVLLQGTNCVMIDTGEKQDADSILAFLQEKQIQEISLLILTHPDKDHIGGAPALIQNIAVKRIVQPHYTKSSEPLEELNALIKTRNIPNSRPKRVNSYAVGEMQLRVFPPLEKHYNKDNNYSLVTLLTHKSVNMVFAGDAEEKRLQELLQVSWPEIALYKVAHHGRPSKSSGEFIRLLRPMYAVVTAKSSDEEIKHALQEVDAIVSYTGDGLVSFYSDGSSLRLQP